MKPKVPADLEAELEGIRLTSPVFCINLFSDKPVSELGRDALVPFERYREIVGDDHVRFYATANMRKHKKVTKRALGMLETWLTPGAKLDDYVFLIYQDSADFNDAPTSSFLIAGAEEVDGERSDDATIIRIALPLQLGIDEPDQMLALTTELWNKLPFRCGQAGFALETTRYLPDQAHEHAYAKSMRHPGIDIPDAANDAIMVAFDKIRGVGWLTMLDDAFVEQLGGISALRKAVGKKITVTELDYGVMLQAGPVPLFGDVNAKDDLPLYRKVYAAVEPLMTDVSDAPSLNIGGDFESRMEAWLTRFGS